MKQDKDLKDFVVKFEGTTTVKAYTQNNAEAKVLSLKNIPTQECIDVRSTAYWIGKSILRNIGAIVTMIFGIGLVVSWMSLLDAMQTLPEELRFIGLIVAFVLLIATLRIPKQIGGIFGNIGRY